jgi:hypothetical protein
MQFILDDEQGVTRCLRADSIGSRKIIGCRNTQLTRSPRRAAGNQIMSSANNNVMLGSGTIGNRDIIKEQPSKLKAN